jgi:hypothetical protein
MTGRSKTEAITKTPVIDLNTGSPPFQQLSAVKRN